MTNHDPLCPYTGTMHSVACLCRVIDEVRADERERIRAAWEARYMSENLAQDLLAEIEPLIHADLRARVKMLDQFPWVDGPERRLMVLIDDVLDLIGGGDE